MALSYEPFHLIPPSTQATVTSLAFDSWTDLLWTGSSTGIVQSFASPESFHRNVSFPSYSQSNNAFGLSRAIKEIIITERDVLSLGERFIGNRKRGGLARWGYINSELAGGFSSIALSPANSSELVVAGSGPEVQVVSLLTGQLVRKMDSPPLMFLRRTHRSLVSGGADGLIKTHDMRTGGSSLISSSSVQAHLGGLTSLEVRGDYIFTCGYGVKQGHPLPDPQVNIYDVRNLRSALPPISFPAGPSFLLSTPQTPSHLTILSSLGMAHTLNIHRPPEEGEFFQMEISSYITSAAVSNSGSYIAAADGDGSVHVWSNVSSIEDQGSLPRLNGYDGLEVDFPALIAADPQIDWNSETPLNLIGMPYYNQPLLSNLPPSVYSPVATSPLFNPPTKIPPSVTSTMRIVDGVAYTQLPKELRGTRNVVGGRKNTKNGGPKFRSVKAREDLKEKVNGDDEAESADKDSLALRYGRVEIKYSKFGVEDFDFGFYNRTHYSGLETHLPNSYANALLQNLHFVLPFRHYSVSHISTLCQKENCLLCESGFLFRMLEDAKGANCQASNFSRAFSATPQAMALGLTDSEEGSWKRDYAVLAQSLNRFLLESMATEAQIFPANLWITPPHPLSGPRGIPAPNGITQLVGTELRQSIVCGMCGFRSERGSWVHVVDLVYPRKALSNEAPVAKDFYSILHSSIARDTTTKSTCANCKLYAPTRQTRSLTPGSVLPPVLSINGNCSQPEHMHDFWLDQRRVGGDKHFLPTYFEVTTWPSGEFVVSKPGDDTVQKGGKVARYELRAFTVAVEFDGEQQHLVSMIKVPVEELDPTVESPWFVFNDFTVQNAPEDEVLSFAGTWKTPAVMFYERIDSNIYVDLSPLPMGIDPAILCSDVSMSWNRDPRQIKHRNLAPPELPKAGSLVAIDAEFVAMQLDDFEFRSDGTKKVIRPSRLCLARVSVLRGSGNQAEVPFIDDYIHTSEPVVDYLTEFSGIHHGDLDPSRTPHTLVPLKVAYKKLRLLVDSGCIFIGHGLKKDFRIINIFVPPNQVLDTVDLFYSPSRQRKMSLRFLAWFFLKIDMQAGEHDSIEDARTALLLYRLFEDFEKEGRLEDVMDDIFAEGKRLNWKPPASAPTGNNNPSRPHSTSQAPPSDPRAGLNNFPTLNQQYTPGFHSPFHQQPIQHFQQPWGAQGSWRGGGPTQQQ